MKIRDCNLFSKMEGLIILLKPVYFRSYPIAKRTSSISINETRSNKLKGSEELDIFIEGYSFDD